jgi:hypothetical protein
MLLILQMVHHSSSALFQTVSLDTHPQFNKGSDSNDPLRLVADCQIKSLSLPVLLPRGSQCHHYSLELLISHKSPLYHITRNF